MRAALDQALHALEDEVPVGAVVVHDGVVVCAAFNQPILANDPTAHAKMVALRSAPRTLGNCCLTSATLYVTIERCLMCASSLVHARWCTHGSRRWRTAPRSRAHARSCRSRRRSR